MFAAIDPSWDFQTFEAPQGRPLVSLGGVDRERRSVSYAVKGTWQLSPSNRIDASFFGDPSTGFNGTQRPGSLIANDISGYSGLTYGGNNQTVRYSGVLASTWLVEASWARAVNSIAETPSVNTDHFTDPPDPSVVSGASVL